MAITTCSASGVPSYVNGLHKHGYAFNRRPWWARVYSREHGKTDLLRMISACETCLIYHIRIRCPQNSLQALERLHNNVANIEQRRLLDHSRTSFPECSELMGFEDINAGAGEAD